MITIRASHYSWFSNSMSKAFDFVHFLEGMGYQVDTTIVITNTKEEIEYLIALN